MEVNVRIMTIDDYDKVYALWMSCKNMGFNNLDDSRDGIEKYLNRNPATCFVAEQEGMVVGVILSGHDGRRGFIHHMAVAESCRRQGIATMLLDRAVDALKQEGINVVLVNFSRTVNVPFQNEQLSSVLMQFLIILRGIQFKKRNLMVIRPSFSIRRGNQFF